MIYLAALLAAASFLITLERVRILPVAGRTVGVAKEALASIRDPLLADQEKETKARKASLMLMGNLGSIVVRGAAAVGVSAVPLLAFEAMGLASVSAVTQLLATWEAIVTISVAMAITYIVKKKH